jgi:hypothetical protein
MTPANPNKGMCVDRKIDFILCEYFNENGRRVERIGIIGGEDDDAADTLREGLVRVGTARRLLDALKAEARASGAETSLDDGATALQALIRNVAAGETPLADARKITSLSVNYRKAVTIQEVVGVLETKFGGHSVSWARGIFTHLNLGPAGIQ